MVFQSYALIVLQRLDAFHSHLCIRIDMGLSLIASFHWSDYVFRLPLIQVEFFHQFIKNWFIIHTYPLLY